MVATMAETCGELVVKKAVVAIAVALAVTAGVLYLWQPDVQPDPSAARAAERQVAADSAIEDAFKERASLLDCEAIGRSLLDKAIDLSTGSAKLVTSEKTEIAMCARYDRFPAATKESFDRIGLSQIVSDACNGVDWFKGKCP